MKPTAIPGHLLCRGVAWAVVAAAVALAGAAVADDLPPGKRTKAGLYLTAVGAAALAGAPDVRFIDVRTRAEVAFVGHPAAIDVHIPFMRMPAEPVYDPETGVYALEPNPDFEMAFWDYADATDLAEDARIVLICRSGTRSSRAADVLYDLGYTNVWSVVEGFEGDMPAGGLESGRHARNGWKNAGLDWTYALSPSQVYPPDRD